RDLVAAVDHVAEEHPQHADVRAVVAEMSRWVLWIGRGEQRCPTRLGSGRRVAVLRRPWDRIPRPPEVPVVLVVPAVDPRIRSTQVRHREEAGAVGDVDRFSSDELAGGGVPAGDGWG